MQCGITWSKGPEPITSQPLFRKIDCIQLYVDDLEAGLSFYHDQLGHTLIWRSDTQAGLRLPESDAEIVLQTERTEPEVDLLVDSVDQAVQRFAGAGGKIIVPPFDIRIGRCVVVADAWGNTLVLVDMTHGPLSVDDEGNVTGSDASS
jgi:lactoylglutathione lyase